MTRDEQRKTVMHLSYKVEQCILFARTAKTAHEELIWLKDLVFYSAELRAYTEKLIELMESKDEKG